MLEQSLIQNDDSITIIHQHEHGQITLDLKNHNCIDWLRNTKFDKKCVVITDPPYSEHVHSSAISQSFINGTRKREFGFVSITSDIISATCEFVGANANWCAIYSDIEGVGLWHENLKQNAQYIRSIPWIRWSMPCVTGNKPCQGSELIVFGHGRHNIAKKGETNCWKGPGNLTHFNNLSLRGSNKHKTEKPLDQVLELLEYMTEPGTLVVDPFAGRATVGQACRILGRNYVGFEIDEDEFIKGKERLSKPLSESDLKRLCRYNDNKKKRDIDLVRVKKINDNVKKRNAERAERKKIANSFIVVSKSS